MRRCGLLLALSLAALLALAPAARAEFGLSAFDVTFTDPPGGEAGAAVKQAGAHPFVMSTFFEFLSEPFGEDGRRTDEAAKDVILTQADGFVGNPTAVERCIDGEFLVCGGVLVWASVRGCWPRGRIAERFACSTSSRRRGWWRGLASGSKKCRLRRRRAHTRPLTAVSCPAASPRCSNSFAVS